MLDLAGRKIILGVTGGVAAFKAATLTRILGKSGADVQVVMTNGALKFITNHTLQALSGKPVATDMWDSSGDSGMPHIDISRGKDLIIVAPAVADFIAKLAVGRADDLLSAICLARECPLLIAPAMNKQMWDNPSTQRNISLLRNDLVEIIGPEEGDQACGEIGAGRMSEPDEIHNRIKSYLQPKYFEGTNVLITAGATFEPIDAVRGITNMSSGRMGFSVAQAAVEAGAKVTLVAGQTTANLNVDAEIHQVRTAKEMLATVNKLVKDCNIFISVAAVADYQVVNPSKTKLKKTDDNIEIKLQPTTDILQSIASSPIPPFCVGFAAESENLETYAESKRKRKNVPLMAANLAHKAIGSDFNELALLDDNGIRYLKRSSKLDQARELVRHIYNLYKEKKSAYR